MYLKILLILLHKYCLLRTLNLKGFAYYCIYSCLFFYSQLLLHSCKKDTLFTTSVWNDLFWAHDLYWGGKADAWSSNSIKENDLSSASNLSFRWAKGAKVFAPWVGCRCYAVLQMAILQQTRGSRGCAAPVLAGEMGLKVFEDSLGQWEQVKNKIFRHFLGLVKP